MKSVRRARKGLLGNCQGQALVEFAALTIPLLMLLFGVIEISRIMLVYTTVANAARIGARYAIANSTPPGTTAYYPNIGTLKSNVTTIVQGFAAAGTLNTSSTHLTVTVSYPNSSCTGSTSTSTCTGTTPGSPVQVTVSYIYDPLLSYFSFGTITLTSTSEGVITW